MRRLWTPCKGLKDLTRQAQNRHELYAFHLELLGSNEKPRGVRSKGRAGLWTTDTSFLFGFLSRDSGNARLMAVSAFIWLSPLHFSCGSKAFAGARLNGKWHGSTSTSPISKAVMQAILYTHMRCFCYWFSRTQQETLPCNLYTQLLQAGHHPHHSCIC